MSSPPTEVALDEDDGVPRPCVVSLDNVQPLFVALLVEPITSLSITRMAEVGQALAVAADCD